MTNRFVLFIIFKLFHFEFINQYPKDYFDELSDVILKRSIYRCDFTKILLDEDLLHISCHFLYSSKKRFEFCQHYVRYCKKLLDII